MKTKKTVAWLTVIMLSLSNVACGGANTKSETGETLNSADQEKAKRLAEIDHSMAEAIKKEDYASALSMKDEMLKLSADLGLSGEYDLIARKLEDVASKNGVSAQNTGTNGVTETISGADTTTDSTTTNFTILHLGDTIKTDFAEISLNSFDFTDNVQKSVKVGSFTHTTGPAPVNGKYYALAEGTIKNISKSQLPVYDFFIGVLDVDGYTYKLGASDCDILDESGQSMSNIDPLINYELRLYVSVPEELINTAENATLSMGFFDKFDNQELSRIRNDEDVIEKCPYANTYDLLSVSRKASGTDGTKTKASDESETHSATTENVGVSSVKKASTELPILAIGDTVTGDDYEFTLNKIEFTYELLPEDTSSLYRSYTPANDKVYVHIDGMFYNKSKRDYCVRDLPKSEVDYDNGYSYSGFSIANDPSRKSDFLWVSSYVVCTPLETGHYHGLVECPKVVEGSDAPLFVTITMPDGKTYRSNVRE